MEGIQNNNLSCLTPRRVIIFNFPFFVKLTPQIIKVTLTARYQSQVERVEKFQKELLNQVIEKLEQLAQQFAGRRTIEIGETSFNESLKVHTLPREIGNFNNFMPQTVKLDFPKYDGMDEPIIWICRAEKYFSLYEIRESDKVSLASFYLEGDAQLWFQMLEQEMIYVT